LQREPGFDTGAYYHYEREKKDNIIFRIKDGGQEYFKEGFYDKGFAIARDKDGNIELVFDYNNGLEGSAKQVTEQVKKHVDDMLTAGTNLESTQRSLGDVLDNMRVNKTSDTSWEIEGEISPEQLKSILGQ